MKKIFHRAKNLIDRFHCHAINTAQKNTSETVQWKTPRNECYKRQYINNSFKSQVFVGHSFWVIGRDVSRAILVRRFGTLIWPPEINKNIWSSVFVQKLFLILRELAHVRINVSSNSWLYCWKSRGETFFNETAFLFWCHALWKLRSSNCCIFEMKHATGLETCTRIYFLYFDFTIWSRHRENHLYLQKKKKNKVNMNQIW